MTDATLKLFFDHGPSLISALFAGVAAVVSSFALKKGNENGLKADVVNDKADAIVVKTEEIHALANGNLSKITEDLRVANENIANFRGVDDRRLITILERHQLVLNRLDTDVSTLTSEVRGVRERQHELANFLNGVGLKFELTPITSVELKPVISAEKVEKEKGKG